MRTLAVLFGTLILLGPTTHADDRTALNRVQATPSWSVLVPRDFKQLDNGDSWQATDDQRVIYVSSLKVSPDPGTSAVAVAEQLTSKLLLGADGKTGAILQHHTADLEGRASVFHTERGFDLKGFMIAKSGVVVCVVSFPDRKFQPWAVDTWRSLQKQKASPRQTR